MVEVMRSSSLKGLIILFIIFISLSSPIKGLSGFEEEKLAQEMESYVESEMDEDLTDKFEVVRSNRSRARELLIKGESIRLKKYSDLNGTQINNRLSYLNKSETYTKTSPALYLYPLDKLVLIPSNFDKLAKESKFEEKELLKATIIHELVHAIDDQKYNLTSKISRIESPDKRLAYRALQEGHAVFITNKVLNKHNINASLSEVRGKIFESNVNKESIDFLYNEGGNFVEYLYKKEGVKGIEKAFTEKIPSSTGEILYPERYFNERKGIIDYEKVLQSIKIGNKDWITRNASLGLETVRKLISSSDQIGQKERISNDFLNGLQGTYITPNKERSHTIHFFQFNTTKTSQEFEGILNDLVRKGLKRYKRSDKVKLISNKTDQRIVNGTEIKTYHYKLNTTKGETETYEEIYSKNDQVVYTVNKKDLGIKFDLVQFSSNLSAKIHYQIRNPLFKEINKTKRTTGKETEGVKETNKTNSNNNQTNSEPTPKLNSKDKAIMALIVLLLIVLALAYRKFSE